MDSCISIGSGKRGKSRRALCAALVFAAFLTAPIVSIADDGGVGGTFKEGGIGTAAALSSLVYGPVKVVYAFGGLVASGLAWGFSGGDGEVATTVLTRAVRGTYVISPDTLQGNQEVEFVGRSPQYRTSAGGTAQVAAAPEGATPDGW